MGITTDQKTGILVVSFGTTYQESREKAITAIEKRIQSSFPEYICKRAFTSGIVRKVIRERDGILIPDVEEAIQAMKDMGIQKIVIQPTHMIPGLEYEKIENTVAKERNKDIQILLGRAVLSEEKDYRKMLSFLQKEYEFQKLPEDTALLFMGHGSIHQGNEAYPRLQRVIREAGFSNVYISTVEGTPDIHQTSLELTRKVPYRKIILAPLMIVAGDHIQNDLCGEEEDSWKNMLEKRGYETEGRMQGLGEFPEIQQLYVDRIREMLEVNFGAVCI